jgi:hypothetical protein
VNAFIVEVENRAGQLARVVGALGDAGVNIRTGAGIGLSDSGGFGFITDDEAGALRVFEASSILFKTVEVVIANVPDQAGGLAQAARRLGSAGVNVQFDNPAGTSSGGMGVAFGVNDAEAARAALGDLAADM